MRLTVTTFVTLDGVYQAPGGPGEDDEGGFRHGGWSFPYADEDFGSQLAEPKAEPGVQPHANLHDRQYAGPRHGVLTGGR